MADEGRVSVTITYSHPDEELPIRFTRELSLPRLSALIEMADQLAADDEATEEAGNDGR